MMASTILSTGLDDDQSRMADALAGMVRPPDRLMPPPRNPLQAPDWLGNALASPVTGTASLLADVARVPQQQPLQTQTPGVLTEEDVLRQDADAAHTYELGPRIAELMFGAGTPRAMVAGAGELGAAGGRLIRDPALWHPISSVKLPRPISEMERHQLAYEPPLPPQPIINPADLQNSLLMPLYGDRSATGGFVWGVGPGSQRLLVPTPLQGGPGFVFKDGRYVWASDRGAISGLAGVAKGAMEREGVPVHGVYTAMSPQSVDFSHHPSDILADLIRQNPISRSARKGELSPATQFNNQMLNQWGVDAKPVPDWPGVNTPTLGDYLVNAPGRVRDKFVKSIDSARFQRQGFPSAAEARVAVTEPSLTNVPNLSSGQAVARLDPYTIGATDHRTYNTGMGGQPVGRFSRPVPPEIMWHDLLAQWAQKYPKSGPGYLMQSRTAPFLQPANQQWVDRMSRYLEGAQ